ncbi:MAG: undecaprenyl-diphosphate phosphatase [Flavobacteriales bacterium]|jgi:undecaprenyl-diphosphatase|nr:undecaprenyl-diphosphate phosphatase [Flavobacteriales bacterium]MCB0757836.1 undecaprenyl-diphosphate phosphatase [Flavobacteriales bacterium]
MTIFQAIVIAIVEGLTEFLPVSSTGHMVIVQALLGLEPTEFTKAYMVNIQFGAILSVVVLYWKRFFRSLDLYWKLLVAFIPAAVFGLLLGSAIDRMLENVTVVAVALLLGGIVLLFVDKWFKPKGVEQVSYPRAFGIGLFQCLALVPGVSRSAATIIGGMSLGLTRKQAAEFSFFLAVPTMAAASGYKMLQGWKADPEIFSGDHIGLLLLGNAVAFIVALLAIRSFVGFLTRHGFRAFGWYRIIIGLLLLALLALGTDLNMA